MDFSTRVQTLPRLGVGVSTEFGAGDAIGALDVLRARTEHPDLVQFLELGVELAKGLDRHAEAWLALGAPTTWHFLDVNLDEDEDFDPTWTSALCSELARVRPAWLCGDAGLWHFGPRERGNMLLLPPVLTRGSAEGLARGVRRLRALTGLEVFPENPPGVAYVGDMHLLAFFAHVADTADTGLLLDCAHLAIYQRLQGLDPLDGFADLDLARVVEIHVAGGAERVTDGFAWVEDDHSPEPLPDTWRIVEHVAAHAPNLRAIIYECERNPLDRCLPVLRRLRELG